VDAVAKGSPADAAGFLVGEILTEAGGSPLKAPADLEAAALAAGVGGELELKSERFGEKLAVPVKVAAAPPAEPAYQEAGPRIGVLQLVSDQYGTCLKLEEGVQVATGDALEVVRQGELVGELTVTKLLRPDATYTHGGAECRRGRGTFRKGDEVRKGRR
jgi:hypothetical protein